MALLGTAFAKALQSAGLAAATVVDKGSQTIGHLAGSVEHTATIANSFTEEASKKGPVLAQILTRPLDTVRQITDSVLNPVDRLLTSFDSAINRGFDAVDKLISPSPVVQPIPVASFQNLPGQKP